MAIILRLDRVMADRKISLKDLSEQVENFQCEPLQNQNGQSKRDSFFHLGCDLQSAGLPARGYFGVSARSRTGIAQSSAFTVPQILSVEYKMF